jgi:3,5-epimerase/4-reductase
MKVLTLGSGFVADHLPYQKITERIPLSDAWIKTIMADYKPDVLINCIGKTGRPNVDWCESHKEETMNANVTLPLLLADYCSKNKIHLIQIGSGCIYFGPSPCKGHTSSAKDPGWRETDFANPASFYSKTKYSCDLMLAEMPHVTTLRIRMPVSDQNVPRNLITKLRGYKQVIDIPNSMTFMDDLARCIEWAADNRPGGIFHVANPQPVTAAQIMQEYQKYVPEHQFEIINEHQLDEMTVAKRSNCILSTEKLRLAGFKMTDSEKALTECMAKYVSNMQDTTAKYRENMESTNV